MFGFPRLMDVVGARSGSGDVIERVLVELDRFTPDGWEQEDDITLVAITREGADALPGAAAPAVDETFSVPSIAGQRAPGGGARGRDRRAASPRAGAPRQAEDRDRRGDDERDRAREPVERRAARRASPFARAAGELSVRITDRGGDEPIAEAETPDLEAKLEGLQKPRGWGLFLIQNMVDDVRVETDGSDHTIELDHEARRRRP